MERVLVCIVASTRGHELCFQSFKENVLDELNADLALAVATNTTPDDTDAYWKHAKYRWLCPDYDDVGEAFDGAQRALFPDKKGGMPDWRNVLQTGAIWLGGVHSPNQQPSRTALQQFCRWLLLQGLQKEKLLERYDRFIITRSDFIWLCPHPPLSILKPENMWVPDGEDYGGIADRHLAVSRADVVNCLDLIEPILSEPEVLNKEMAHRSNWNVEQYLLHHLKRRGIAHKIRRFPYVMYLARDKRDNTLTWSSGHVVRGIDHYIKYPGEFRSARYFSKFIHSRRDWEKNAWRYAASHGKQGYMPSGSGPTGSENCAI